MNRLSIDYNGSRIITTLNGNPFFSGKLKKKWFKSVWMLVDSNGNEISQYKIKGECFKQSFDIYLSQQSVLLKLRYENKHPHLSFTHENDHYLVVWHLTHRYSIKYSVFKNNIQIATLAESSRDWSWISFKLLADDKANLVLLLQVIYLVILIAEDIKKDPEYSQVAYYFKELRPFNDSWIEELYRSRQ